MEEDKVFDGYLRLFFLDAGCIKIMKSKLPSAKSDDDLEFDDDHVAEATEAIRSFCRYDEDVIQFIFRPFTDLTTNHAYIIIRHSVLQNLITEKNEATQQFVIQLWEGCFITAQEEMVPDIKSHTNGDYPIFGTTFFLSLRKEVALLKELTPLFPEIEDRDIEAMKVYKFRTSDFAPLRQRFKELGWKFKHHGFCGTLQFTGADKPYDEEATHIRNHILQLKYNAFVREITIHRLVSYKYIMDLLPPQNSDENSESYEEEDLEQFEHGEGNLTEEEIPSALPPDFNAQLHSGFFSHFPPPTNAPINIPLESESETIYLHSNENPNFEHLAPTSPQNFQSPVPIEEEAEAINFPQIITQPQVGYFLHIPPPKIIPLESETETTYQYSNTHNLSNCGNNNLPEPFEKDSHSPQTYGASFGFPYMPNIPATRPISLEDFNKPKNVPILQNGQNSPPNIQGAENSNHFEPHNIRENNMTNSETVREEFSNSNVENQMENVLSPIVNSIDEAAASNSGWESSSSTASIEDMDNNNGVEQDVEFQYSLQLSDLGINSPPELNNALVMLAEDNLAHAPGVVAAIEKYFKKVLPPVKLLVLYLIDAILTKVGKSYIKLFGKKIVPIFCEAYENAEDEKLKSELLSLLESWNLPKWKNVFPPKNMHAIDIRCRELDNLCPLISPTLKGVAENGQNNCGNGNIVDNNQSGIIKLSLPVIPNEDENEASKKKDLEELKRTKIRLELELFNAIREEAMKGDSTSSAPLTKFSEAPKKMPKAPPPPSLKSPEKEILPNSSCSILSPSPSSSSVSDRISDREKNPKGKSKRKSRKRKKSKVDRKSRSKSPPLFPGLIKEYKPPPEPNSPEIINPNLSSGKLKSQVEIPRKSPDRKKDSSPRSKPTRSMSPERQTRASEKRYRRCSEEYRHKSDSPGRHRMPKRSKHQRSLTPKETRDKRSKFREKSKSPVNYKTAKRSRSNSNSFSSKMKKHRFGTQNPESEDEEEYRSHLSKPQPAKNLDPQKSLDPENEKENRSHLSKPQPGKNLETPKSRETNKEFEKYTAKKREHKYIHRKIGHKLSEINGTQFSVKYINGTDYLKIKRNGVCIVNPEFAEKVLRVLDEFYISARDRITQQNGQNTEDTRQNNSKFQPETNHLPKIPYYVQNNGQDIKENLKSVKNGSNFQAAVAKFELGQVEVAIKTVTEQSRIATKKKLEEITKIAESKENNLNPEKWKIFGNQTVYSLEIKGNEKEQEDGTTSEFLGPQPNSQNINISMSQNMENSEIVENNEIITDPISDEEDDQIENLKSGNEQHSEYSETVKEASTSNNLQSIAANYSPTRNSDLGDIKDSQKQRSPSESLNNISMNYSEGEVENESVPNFEHETFPNIQMESDQNVQNDQITSLGVDNQEELKNQEEPNETNSSEIDKISKTEAQKSGAQMEFELEQMSKDEIIAEVLYRSYGTERSKTLQKLKNLADQTPNNLTLPQNPKPTAFPTKKKVVAKEPIYTAVSPRTEFPNTSTASNPDEIDISSLKKKKNVPKKPFFVSFASGSTSEDETSSSDEDDCQIIKSKVTIKRGNSGILKTPVIQNQTIYEQCPGDGQLTRNRAKMTLKSRNLGSFETPRTLQTEENTVLKEGSETSSISNSGDSQTNSSPNLLNTEIKITSLAELRNKLKLKREHERLHPVLLLKQKQTLQSQNKVEPENSVKTSQNQDFSETTNTKNLEKTTKQSESNAEEILKQDTRLNTNSYAENKTDSDQQANAQKLPNQANGNSKNGNLNNTQKAGNSSQNGASTTCPNILKDVQSTKLELKRRKLDLPENPEGPQDT